MQLRQEAQQGFLCADKVKSPVAWRLKVFRLQFCTLAEFLRGILSRLLRLSAIKIENYQVTMINTSTI